MRKINLMTGIIALTVAATMFSPVAVCAANGPAPAAKPAVESTQMIQTASKNGQISVEDAKAAAFAHAGLKEKDVVLRKAALDMDDDRGILKYDVDFYAADKDFEYDIDAATGAVIKAEREAMDAEDYAEMKAIKESIKNKDAAKAADKAAGLNEDGALEIALKHAGVAKSDVTFKNVHLDFDDDLGKTIFDVEFHVGVKEYNYDIDPVTGQIYEFDVDIDD
jgi:uncharacterized membrane protein YkoI